MRVIRRTGSVRLSLFTITTSTTALARHTGQNPLIIRLTERSGSLESAADTASF
jgi:hypothetical protein